MLINIKINYPNQTDDNEKDSKVSYAAIMI